MPHWLGQSTGIQCPGCQPSSQRMFWVHASPGLLTHSGILTQDLVVTGHTVASLRPLWTLLESNLGVYHIWGRRGLGGQRPTQRWGAGMRGEVLAGRPA